MNPNCYTLPGTYYEGKTLTLQFTIRDADGLTPLTNADAVLTGMTLTLFDRMTHQIINSRNVQDVKGANGGSIVGAVMTQRLDAADLHRVSTDRKFNTVVARFEWWWGTPRIDAGYEIEIVVEQLDPVV